MLKQVQNLTIDRSDKEIIFINQSAETLNKDEHGTFDLIITRMALHHFKNAAQAILQMCDCLNDNGYLIISDLYASPNKAIYDINHKIELLHDSSHLKNYTDREIIDIVNGSALRFNVVKKEVILEKEDGISIEYWCSITNARKEDVNEINNVLNSLSGEVLEELGYFISRTNEIRNRVKTNLLIFKLSN